MEFESPLLENAVSRLSQLPGIGRKTALRLALHILRRPESEGTALGQSIVDLRRLITYCRECHNISENEVCPICASESRDRSIICVVENVRDVMAFENTGRYRGLYHVLGGLISPMDGIGPDQLEVESLIDRVQRQQPHEVILALSPTMEGDTTNFYLYRRLSRLPHRPLITQLARGMAIGNEIEYTDELTLARSLEQRIGMDDPLASV